MKCATCGAELIEVGYAVDGFQQYRCPNGCERIFSTTDRIVDAILSVVFLITFVLLILLLLPLIAIGMVFGRIFGVEE